MFGSKSIAGLDGFARRLRDGVAREGACSQLHDCAQYLSHEVNDLTSFRQLHTIEGLDRRSSVHDETDVSHDNGGQESRSNQSDTEVSFENGSGKKG